MWHTVRNIDLRIYGFTDVPEKGRGKQELKIILIFNLIILQRYKASEIHSSLTYITHNDDIPIPNSLTGLMFLISSWVT